MKTYRCQFLSVIILFGFTAPGYAAPGDLDTSFGTGGKVTTIIGGGHLFGLNDDNARSVAFQDDGKILAAGGTKNVSGYNYDFALVRYNTNGSLDTSFGASGKVTTDFNARAEQGYGMAIQSNGKVVVAGEAANASGNSEFAIVRYNTDGSLDSAFGSGGKVTTPIGSNYSVGRSVVIQSNGGIVVAGHSYNGSDYDFALVRYDTNGSLDSTFGTGGKVTTPISTGSEEGVGVSIQSSGKIVVAGTSFSGGSADFVLARYNTNGTLDTSFGSGGRVVTDFGNFDICQSLTLQSDGRIIVAGYPSDGTNSNFHLARYTVDGSLDATFGSGGKVITDFSGKNDNAWSVTVQRDGKIVVAGTSVNGSTWDFALVRYNSNGTPDSGFGGGGKVTTPVGSTTDVGFSIGLQGDGRIVVAGSSSNSGNGGNKSFAIVRYIGSPVPPTVATGAATGSTITGATLNGNVNPNGLATTAQFEYGSTTSYGSTVSVALSPSDGTASQSVSAPLSGLTPGTTYHYRVTATNSIGTESGANQIFTTLPAVAVSSLNRVNSSPSNASTVNWTLTFASAVTGVTSSNFTLSGAAATGSSVGTPTTGNGGLTWNIPVTTGAADGLLSLNLASSTGLSSAISTSLPFVGQSYAMDKTLPTVSIGAPSVSSTTTGPVDFTVTYSDTNFSSSTLANGNVTLNTTGSATGSIAVNGTGNTRTVTISAITGTGSLGISIAAGTATDTAGNLAGAAGASGTLTVIPPVPTVTAISPTSGSTLGGTSVTITGTNLTGATAVTVGGVAATGVSVVNATSITATSPAHAAGTASVLVTTPGGTSAANTLYLYVAPPTVTAINSASGSTLGGTSVTINGTGFTGATGVTIGGAAATGMTVVNATTITATTPAGTAGTASVVVTTPGGSNSANALFTYVAAPTVTAIAPNTGTTAGGTSVTITGTGFTGATGVTIGGSTATGMTVVNATTITATTPARSAGTASLLVTTVGGTNAANTLYTYVAPPTVTLSTASLPTTATTLTITGTGFSTTPGENSVVFTPAGSGSVTASTATSLTVTSLTGLTLGALNAVVTTNSLSSGAAVQVATVVVPPPGTLDSLNLNIAGSNVLATAV